MAETARPIRLGIIGTGLAVEKLHWPALRQLRDQYTVVAFANHTRPKAEAFAAYSGASMDDYHADYRDLLQRDDVEAVLISLPIPLNEPVTRASLEAGKHVICEKPAGANMDEGRKFLALGEQYPDQVVLVAENFFYRDDLRLARALLDGGVIGRPHMLSWRMASQLVPRPGQFSSTPWRQQPGYRGGPQLDAGVHYIAQIRLLAGDVEALHGAARAENPTMGGPSDFTLNMRFVSGAVGNFTGVFPAVPTPPEPNDMRVYGTDGVMTIGGHQVSVYRPDGAVDEYRVEETDNGYYNEFLDFYDAVRHGVPPVASIAQNVHNMLVILRGLDSAEGAGEVALVDAPGGLSNPGVPLWQPRGSTDLFTGLPCRIVHETRRQE